MGKCQIWEPQAKQSKYFFKLEYDPDGVLDLVVVDGFGETEAYILGINNAGELHRYFGIDNDAAEEFGIKTGNEDGQIALEEDK